MMIPSIPLESIASMRTLAVSGVVSRVGYDRPVTRIACGQVDAVVDRGEGEVGQPGHEYADDPGGARAQARGADVPLVAHDRCQFADPADGVGPDSSGVVAESSRDGGDMDSGVAGHSGKGHRMHPPRRRLLWHRTLLRARSLLSSSVTLGSRAKVCEDPSFSRRIPAGGVDA